MLQSAFISTESGAVDGAGSTLPRAVEACEQRHAIFRLRLSGSTPPNPGAVSRHLHRLMRQSRSGQRAACSVRRVAQCSVQCAAPSFALATMTNCRLRVTRLDSCFSVPASQRLPANVRLAAAFGRADCAPQRPLSTQHAALISQSLPARCSCGLQRRHGRLHTRGLPRSRTALHKLHWRAWPWHPSPCICNSLALRTNAYAQCLIMPPPSTPLVSISHGWPLSGPLPPFEPEGPSSPSAYRLGSCASIASRRLIGCYPDHPKPCIRRYAACHL